MPGTSPSRQKRSQGGFVPVNTLSSTQAPTFTFSAPGFQGLVETQINKANDTDMVNQREGPRSSSPRKPSPSSSANPFVIHDDSSELQSTDSAPIASRTVVQQAIAEGRDPYSRDAAFPLMDRTNQPEFGKPSPIGGRTTKLSEAQRESAFIQPRPNKPKFEHHQARPQAQNPPIAGQSSNNGQSSANTTQARALLHQQPIQSAAQSWMTNPYNQFTNVSDSSQRPSFQVPGQYAPPQRPWMSSTSMTAFTGPPLSNLSQSAVIIPPQRPVYSSNTGFTAVNGWQQQQQRSERTSHDADDGFDPNVGIGSAYDPSNYVDATQTSENIKALLEGAFDEDEDDKPKTRLRKRANKKKAEEGRSAVDELADKAKGLTVIDKKDVRAEEHEEEEDDGTVEGLNVRLLPHQIDGLAWMLDKEVGERKRNGVLPKGGILADDMGLGKTIQALALIISNPRPTKEEAEAIAKKTPKRKISEAAGKGTLVVAPLALIRQWESEVKDKISSDSSLKVLVHHGATRTKRYEELKKYDVVVTTYDTLKSEHKNSDDIEGGLKVGCFGVHWYRVILDEAHSIKNRSTQMTKAAYALKAVYRWCLTGTPMQNNLDELQSLICFLNIKPYCHLPNWREQISDPMKRGKGGIAIKRLQYFLKAFMKRRTKDVLKKEGGLTFGKKAVHGQGESKSEGFQIVGRKVETIVTEFNDEERYYYDRLAARAEKTLESLSGNYIGALVLLLRLRQMCNHPDLAQGKLQKGEAMFDNGGHSGSAASADASERVRTDDSVDDIADLFGGLSVKTQKCDTCQADMSPDESTAGTGKCRGCEEDLQAQRRRARRHEPKRSERGHDAKESKRRLHTRRIVESDDDGEEEQEGDWIVPESQRPPKSLGEAGGSKDEDVEGGGEWLRSGDEDDSENDDLNVKADRISSKSKQISRPSDATTASTSNTDRADSDNTISDASATDDKVIVSSTKIRYLIKLLKRETPSHKFIVFSDFTSMLNIIEPFLEAAGLRYVRYDGSMRNDAREASLQALRTKPKVRVLLCSLKCGSLGLNLTAASRVVIFEPFWNPFVEEQAIDRVHRLNQTQDVVVYRLTVANSVEERILQLQEKKRELAKAALDGGKAVGKLTMQDVLRLFKSNAEDHAGEGHSALDPVPLTGFNKTGGMTAALPRTNNGIVDVKAPRPTQLAPKDPKAPLTPSKKQQASQNSALVQAKAQRDRDRAANGGALESELYGRRW
ncbi:MAG: hypothetical protein M1828_006716 [Chrysothrix sp. TS-e1954]|nr:MAG: hypothetical protein M1828_006716 [Chrysothrix sp. TS-e1954]